MFVTFSASRLRAWTPGTLKMLNESPFAGVASTVVGAYDTDPVPSLSEFESAVIAVKSYSLAKLAEHEGLTEAETVLKLRDLGKRMAQVVAAEFPQAVIWSLFLQLSALTQRSQITRLAFYIAENWYRHGDAVTFCIDGVRFLKQVTPEIRCVDAAPIVAASTDKALRLECHLAGETTKPELGVEFTVTRQGATADVARRQLPATSRTVGCELPIRGWQPGAYVCQARLLRGETCLDSGEAAFAVVGE